MRQLRPCCLQCLVSPNRHNNLCAEAVVGAETGLTMDAWGLVSGLACLTPLGNDYSRVHPPRGSGQEGNGFAPPPAADTPGCESVVAGW